MTPPIEPLPEEYREFWRLWGQQKYFECHEVLEDVWRSESDNDRKQFFHGLIHCSVAMVHVSRQNEVGARAQLAKARAKLAGCRQEYSGCDTGAVLEFVEKRLADTFKTSANVGEIL